jgi:hypothetical protein
MTSKLPYEKNSQFMFQICVPNQKVEGKMAMHYIPEIFFNEMIRNIKIQNIFYVIGISKSMERVNVFIKKNL